MLLAAVTFDIASSLFALRIFRDHKLQSDANACRDRGIDRRDYIIKLLRRDETESFNFDSTDHLLLLRLCDRRALKVSANPLKMNSCFAPPEIQVISDVE